MAEMHCLHSKMPAMNLSFDLGCVVPENAFLSRQYAF